MTLDEVKQETCGPCPQCKNHYGDNRWERGWDCARFLKNYGFITDSEVKKVRKRIEKDHRRENP